MASSDNNAPSTYDAPLASPMLPPDGNAVFASRMGSRDGLRVKKCAPNCSSPTSSTVYIFSGSKVIAEYDNGAAASSPTREYLYAGSQFLAKIDSSGTKYYHQDHLSNRLITDSSGNASEQKGHFPFGEDWYQGTDKWKFTTYERDSESGNDYAMARSYVNRLARFSSPDLHAGSIWNPQSLNRYSYVLNNPINLFDPFGLDHCDLPKETRLHAPKATSADAQASGPNGDAAQADGDDPTDPNSGPEACQSKGGTWVVSNCWGNGCDDFPSGGGGGDGGPDVGTGFDGGPVPTTVCSIIGPDGEDTGLICTQQGGGAPGGGGGNGGPTIGPAPPPRPPLSCSLPSRIWNSIETTGKFGVAGGAHIGPLEVEVSAGFKKNNATGESTLGAEASLLTIGVEVSKTITPGNSGIDPTRIQVTGNVWTTSHNFTTGTTTSTTSHVWKFGGQLFIGGEASFNYDTYQALSAQCRAASHE